MTKVLLTCCLAALLCNAGASHAALGSPAPKSVAANDEVRPEATARQASTTRWPGLNWYLGVGCVSLLAVQRLRWFNPQRRQQHPRV